MEILFDLHFPKSAVEAFSKQVVKVTYVRRSYLNSFFPLYELPILENALLKFIRVHPCHQKSSVNPTSFVQFFFFFKKKIF